MKRRFLLICSLMFLQSCVLHGLIKRPDNIVRVIQNPEPQPGDGFGWCLAAYDSKLLAGAPHDNFGAKNSGSAYLFNIETGALLYTFHNPDPQEDAQFGWPVVVTSNCILLGAHSDGTPTANEGAVHIYDKETRKHLMKLKCPDASMTQEFGRSICVVNNTFLVTTLGTMLGVNRVCAYYFFDEEGVCQRRIYNKKAYDDLSRFGINIYANKYSILIGADLNPVSGKKDCGSVYLYDFEGKQIKMIPNPNPDPKDRFGMKAIFVGENMAVCAPGDDTITTNSGAVYLFNLSGDLLRTFHNPSPIECSEYGGPHFGAEIAAWDNNTILINGMEYDSQNKISGVVFAFDVLTGKIIQTFRSSKTEAMFGSSILAHKEYVLIGSTYADVDNIKEAGCVYFFPRTNQRSKTITK